MLARKLLSVLAVGVAALSLFTSLPARAQAWPTQPIRIIVGFGPGSGIDIIARELGQAITGPLKQTIVIENRAGAAGQIAVDHVASAKADGYTVLIVSSTSILSQIINVPKTDLQKDFDVLVHAGRIPYVMAIPAALGPTSIREFIEYARQRPGKTNFASIEGGLPQYLGELLKANGKIDITGVPYKSTTDGQVDVLAGRVHVLFTTLASAIPLAKNDRARVVGVTGERRNPNLPNVPTMIEAGAPYLDLDASFYLMVPAGTPRAIIARLNEALSKAQTTKAVVDRFSTQGIAPGGGDVAHARQTLTREFERWRQIAKPKARQG